MKKDILLFFTKFLCILFIIGTITILFMVYGHIDNKFASKFGMYYLYLVLFMIIYVPFITIVNSRKLKWYEIKNRLFMFIGIFILIVVLNYGFDYVFRPSKIDILREVLGALGIAFTCSFVDITFLKNKKN